MAKQTEKRIQRSSHDIRIVMTDEEEVFRKRFFEKLGGSPNLQKCTICSKDAGPQVYSHPALGVTVCLACYHAYENTVFVINEDGTDTQCRWCGKPADKYSCSKCTCLFCQKCLERNYGDIYVENAIDNIASEWTCLICYPKLLWGVRGFCARAMMDYENSQTPSTNKQNVTNIVE